MGAAVGDGSTAPPQKRGGEVHGRPLGFARECGTDRAVSVLDLTGPVAMTKRPRATNEMMLPLHNLSLLNTDVIDLNIHAIPLILVGLVLFGVGVMVLIREGASSLGRWFFAFASAMGLYCVGAGVSYTLKIAALALDWERTALMGVALIIKTILI